MAEGHENAKSFVETYDSETGKSFLFQSAISGADGFGAKWYKSKEMVESYYKLAESNDAESQYELAHQLERTDHVGPFLGNISESVKWYKRAAENGVIDAMFNLGILYRRGKGDLLPDPEQALRWMKLAADAGDREAKELAEKWSLQQ